MDLLFQRYASPFLLIDGFVRVGHFEKFVFEFVETVRKEREEKANWEFFLHKVFDKSYRDFIDDMETDRATAEMTETEKETAVLNSLKILGDFNPTLGVN